MKKFLPLIALALTSCQIGPNYYELESPSKTARVIEHKGYHGAHGCAYKAGMEAVLLAKSEDECTDEEWVEDYQDIPGQGYYDGQWSGSHADELAKLHFFQGEDGKVYLFDDETGEMTEFEFERVDS